VTARRIAPALAALVLGAGCGREGIGLMPGDELQLSGFHYAAGDLTHQDEVDHDCVALDNDLVQCALYAPGRGTLQRLVGVEHVVSRRAFDALPADERALWHTHSYEVRSGLLIAPDLPIAEETRVMERLVTTYGKTWQVWHSHDDDDPLGTATLMKAVTADGQIDAALVVARDERLGVDTEQRRKARVDIEDPGFDPVTLEEPVVGVCKDGTTGGDDAE
jgi:hypothetical protein